MGDETSIIVMQGTGKIRAVGLDTGALVYEVQVWPEKEVGAPFVGQLLTLGGDGVSLFVLSPTPSSSDSIAVLNVRNGALLDRIELSRGVSYRSLIRGGPGEKLYALGNREDGAVVATVVSPDGGAILEELLLRRPDGRNWLVYEAAIDEKAGRLLVGYHGEDTDGIDWFELTADLVRCPDRRSNETCIKQHGGFEVRGNEIYTATGTPRIEKVSWSGSMLASLNTELDGNHLLQFALSSDTSWLYAVGSCGYRPGFAVVNTKTGDIRRSSSDPRLCGEKLVAVEATDFVAIAKALLPVPPPGDFPRPDGVLIVNVETAELVTEIETVGEPLDFVIVARNDR